MKRILKSTFGSPVALILNLILAYAIYFIARVTYFCVNYSYFIEGFASTPLSHWLKGGFMFDTTAILYTNALYLLMMLLLKMFLKLNHKELQNI
jgi:hypothetical protein